MDLGIRGKLALVTGASQGIGREVALTLAQEGARVLAVARSQDKLKELVTEIEQIGGEAYALPADLGKPGTVEGVLREAAKAGTVEIFLGNTGGPKPMQAQEMGAEEVLEAARSLLFPMLELTRGLLPGMQEARFGRILYITSLAVKEPIENLALSNTVRSGLTGYAKTLAREVAPFGITVNTLGPGYTRTERVEEVFQFRAQQQGIPVEEAYHQQAQQIPVGRLGTPKEIADVAVFMLSANASYLTGQTLVVDGGFTRGLL
ncbi:short-chain dehydrogenase/reductase SDR [Allomeiothermus silvanus DSM 9946]|uniref:Short-chain dehydrogenase/reductase SDR n=1 Tax=Allomeiothermus silvanus (strain ATCC 700542 / DSM 9946 / NBRC 106475 / NCIMB 13440 / VI-R2) TaxID=526227 RepID=D7BCJ2_ALLS1|nr:SDR family oxidoreductase [Allomeiothermus silvanus]ADH62877.1 short-chain dehydrogenase/reductase SDR [Allomeiothermus silvanus DSM 9946]